PGPGRARTSGSRRSGSPSAVPSSAGAGTATRTPGSAPRPPATPSPDAAAAPLLRGRAAAQRLRPAAAHLRLGGPTTGPPGRCRRPARGRRWGERRPEELGEPRGGRLPVAQLGAVLARRDGEPAVDDPARERREDALTLTVVERGCRAEVHGELDTGVGGVHPLAARAGGAGEAPLQLVLADDDAARHVEVCGH